MGELDDSCVIRPGGLYGSGRHPAKYMSGRTVLSGREEKVNLVSGESLTELILKAKEKGPKVINAVNSHHPLKTAYYTEVCQELGLEPPQFEITANKGKVVSTCYPQFEVISPI